MSQNGSSVTPQSVERTLDADVADRQPISMVVARAIASLADTSPTEIEPLYYSIDPDPLNELFGTQAGAPRSARSLTFRHMDYRVTIDTDPELTITVTEV